jgi:hypothetical protein
MKNFEIYKYHLKPYTQTSSTILISGDYHHELPMTILDFLGQDTRIVFLAGSGVRPNITLDFQGFTENYWNVSAFGLYIPFIKNLDPLLDYTTLTHRDKLLDFINGTGFIHQYEDFLVIEKRPTPRVISGTRYFCPPSR